MSSGVPRDDEFAARLPLPIAQLYRRASNAKTALDRHHHAYYLAEATLKLAACARIGAALASGLEPRSALASSLERLCLPSVGHWVGFLRETAEYLRGRPDGGLLPLAGTHETLLRAEALPAVRAFAERAAAKESDGSPPISGEEARRAAREGILGFFSLAAAYRNQVFGHGALRVATFYEELGPLLLDAACEVLEKRCLFGDMTLAVARLLPDPSGQQVGIEWQGLRGLGSFTLPREAVGPELAATRPVPGEVYFIAPGVRVSLHPLVVYQEDRSERERVGFLNRTLLRREGGEVRRVEHLDYATGDLLSGFDAREALALLLGRLRGQPARPSDVDRLIDASQAEPHEVTPPVLGAGATIGDFELEGEIGRGGMGIVYRARQRSLNRLVALKVLPPALAADPVALARFRREIAALARSEHPHLVKILTSGSDGDRHFFAMELVEGVNLGDLFEVLSRWRRDRGEALREGHLAAAVSSSSVMAERRRSVQDSLPEVEKIEPGPAPRVGEGPALHLRLAGLFADAAEAVAHLHARGILHRDLKPANLMLTADGRRLVVMDLGVAQVRDRSQSLTRTVTRWVGTLRYSAPEQLQRNLLDVDERADVYGLGATLYELVTLAPLFDGDTEPRLIEQVLHQEPRPPERIEPAVPRDLAAIITTCLDKDRTRRYANPRDLAEDLRRFQGGLPVRVRPLGTPRRLWRWCRRNRALAAASGLAVAGLLAVAVISSVLAVKERQNALEFQRRVAESDLTRGQKLCEDGDIARGLHWMVRALGEAPATDADLHEAIRMNLGGWSRRWVAPLAVIQAPRGEPCLAFSPDGKRLVVGTYEKTARIWSAETGDPVGRSMDHGEPVLAVAFRHDARCVATACRDGTARLWSADTGEPISPRLEHQGPVHAVEFSPDGKLLLTASDDSTARFWSADTGEPIGRPLRHNGIVEDVAFSPDGKLLLTGSADGVAQLWSVESRDPIGPPLRHEGAVLSVAYSPDGKHVLTGSGDRTARLWAADTGEPVGPPLRHDLPILATAFSPDGKLAATTSYDRTARLWRVDRGEPHGLPLQHRDSVVDLAFSPDGTLVATGSYDHTSRIWSVETGEPLGDPLKHDNVVHRIAFSPTGDRLATGSNDETVKVWPARTREPLGRVLGQKVLVWSIAFSPDGKRVITGDNAGTARLWSTDTGEAIGPPFQHPSPPAWTVAFSPDGKRVAIGGGARSVHIWSVETRQPVLPPLRHEESVREVAFSPDGRQILTGSFDRTARLWSADTGEPIGRPLRHDGIVEDVAFSPDGKILLTGSSDRTARLWSAATQEPIGRTIQHRGAVLAVAFTPDGERFLTGGRDNVVRFWSVKDGAPAGPTLEHTNWIEDLAVSPDGRLVVTGSADQTARLWSAPTGRLLASYWRHGGSVYSVAMSLDGRRVATAGRAGGTARIWDVPTPLEGDLEQVRFEIEALTGLEMKDDGVIFWLDPATWHERRRPDAVGPTPRTRS